jgi:creatinine amidohydrolase
MVRDILEAAASSGIDSAVVLSAHADPRHQISLERACDDVNERTDILALSPAGALFSAAELGIKTVLGPEASTTLKKAPNDFHAGWIETSMMLELDESLVSASYTSLDPVDISPRDMANPEILAERTHGRGWLGSPALASRGAGGELLEKSADFIERAVIALIERKGWEMYSHHFLFGKSFFPQD